MVTVAFALAGVGPGEWSLDHALGIDWSSTGWALLALGVGLIVGVGRIIAGRMWAARDERGPRAHPV
jgi:hypothetical protein